MSLIFFSPKIIISPFSVSHQKKKKKVNSRKGYNGLTVISMKSIFLSALSSSFSKSQCYRMVYLYSYILVTHIAIYNSNGTLSTDERTYSFVISMTFFLTGIRPYEFSMNFFFIGVGELALVIHKNVFHYTGFLTVCYIFVPWHKEHFC